jgi:ABC-type transporter Mla subunit MlaD
VPAMYEAASQNYREVEKALTQLERSITSALRRNDESSVEALARLQLLLTSVKAEARLTKIELPPVLRTGWLS